MASKIVVNNFDRYKRDLHAEMDRRVARAAITVQRHAKQLLSVSGTGVWGPTGAGGVQKLVRAVKRTRKTVYGAFPSRPGEPPHKQTGRLRASVTWEKVRAGLARVGTNVKYGRLLELFVGPRPWLRRALAEESRDVAMILGAPWKWSG